MMQNEPSELVAPPSIIQGKQSKLYEGIENSRLFSDFIPLPVLNQSGNNSIIQQISVIEKQISTSSERPNKKDH